MARKKWRPCFGTRRDNPRALFGHAYFHSYMLRLCFSVRSAIVLTNKGSGMIRRFICFVSEVRTTWKRQTVAVDLRDGLLRCQFGWVAR